MTTLNTEHWQGTMNVELCTNTQYSVPHKIMMFDSLLCPTVGTPLGWKRDKEKMRQLRPL